jgi:acetyl-CoA carboxylase carboxyltransferase component
MQNDVTFNKNKESTEPILKKFLQTVDSVINYNDNSAFKRLKEKNKLKVRERIEKLID